MYSGVILCLLVAAVSAVPSPPLMMHGKPVQMPPKINPDKLQDAPEKCCADPYFTFKNSGTQVFAEEGKLKSEYVNVEGAYDSIAQAIGLQGHRTLSNGTTIKFQLIVDYKKGEGYSLKEEGEELNCTKFSVETPFPYGCLPEDSQFIGSTTVGDHALKVDNWYINDKESPEGDAHIVYSIEPSECVEVSRYSRLFNPETGEELKLKMHSSFDFNLGICDPDKWFKPPDVCLEKSTVKSIPKELTELPGFFGKRLF